MRCPDCNGYGVVDRDCGHSHMAGEPPCSTSCEVCGGTGSVPEPESQPMEWIGMEAGTVAPFAVCCTAEHCTKSPGADICLACAIESEEGMAAFLIKGRAA